MAFDHAKARAEFEALPEWAKGLVEAARKSVGHGITTHEIPLGEAAVNLCFKSYEEASAALDAVFDLCDFARDLTAPDPSAYADLPPNPALAAFNVVELMDDEEAFDQPCRFGHRVGGHAVYCHNELWPGAPRKCRRTWYTGGDVRDEDCPGYAPNPALQPNGS